MCSTSMRLLPLLLSRTHFLNLCFYVVFVLFVFGVILLLTHCGQPALMSKFAFLAARHGVT